MSVDQSARLRAFELVQKSERPMRLQEAYETVYSERYGDDAAALLKALAQLATNASKALAKATYELPDPDNGQFALFDIPAVIVNNTPDGPLFIPRDLALGQQVKQWLQEGHRHHSTQGYRFKKGLRDVELLDEDELQQPWTELRPILADRKLAAIEAAS